MDLDKKQKKVLLKVLSGTICHAHFQHNPQPIPPKMWRAMISIPLFYPLI